MATRKFELGKDAVYSPKVGGPARAAAAIDPASRLPGKPPVLGPLARKI